MAEEQATFKGEGRWNPATQFTGTKDSQGQPKGNGSRILDATHPPNVKTGSKDDIPERQHASSHPSNRCPQGVIHGRG